MFSYTIYYYTFMKIRCIENAIFGRDVENKFISVNMLCVRGGRWTVTFEFRKILAKKDGEII